MISPSQNVQLWFDTDNTLKVAMDPPVDVSSWTLTMEIFQDTVGVFVDKTVTKTNPAAGIFETQVSPDLDLLDIAQKYHYRFLRTDTGARDVLAWGGINLKKLK